MTLDPLGQMGLTIGRQELQRTRKVARSSVLKTLTTYGGRLAIAIGVTAVSFGSYYVFTTVGLAYLAIRHVPSAYGLYGTVIGAALSLPVILLSGRASDVWGSRPLYMFSACAMGLWAFAFFPLLDTGSPALIILAMATGLVAWSVLYGVQGAFLPELFPTEVRYTGASLAYQVTGAVGGLIPVASISLLQSFGTPFSISVLVLGTALISLVATWAAPETGHLS